VIPLGSVREKFIVNFLGTHFQAQGIHECIKKVRSTGSLLDKNPARKCCVLTEEKLDDIEVSLEHTTQKSL
jgi:hypothetical protein